MKAHCASTQSLPASVVFLVAVHGWDEPAEELSLHRKVARECDVEFIPSCVRHKAMIMTMLETDLW